MNGPVQVEPRNLTWLSLVDAPLMHLTIRTAHGGTYCDLHHPSTALAAAALWEAVTRYAREYAGQMHIAPPLEIYAEPLR